MKLIDSFGLLKHLGSCHITDPDHIINAIQNAPEVCIPFDYKGLQALDSEINHSLYSMMNEIACELDSENLSAETLIRIGKVFGETNREIHEAVQKKTSSLYEWQRGLEK